MLQVSYLLNLVYSKSPGFLCGFSNLEVAVIFGLDVFAVTVV